MGAYDAVQPRDPSDDYWDSMNRAIASGLLETPCLSRDNGRPWPPSNEALQALIETLEERVRTLEAMLVP